MAAPLSVAFALRNFSKNLGNKPICCLKNNQIQCRQMGFLGNLKWVGKDKQEAGAEMDEVQAALEVYGKSDSAKKRQCIETVRAYTPPVNVEEQLHSLTVEVFGHVVDWKNQSLSDRFKKYKFLTKAINQFDHDIPSFDLHLMSKVEDTIKYFQTEVRDTTKLEDLSKLDLPKNLHMNLEPIRHDHDAEKVDGKAVFPGEKGIVQSLKYRRKYKGYQGPVRLK